MKHMTHMLNWFEIPVENMHRAKKFYEEILDIQLKDVDLDDGNEYAFFPIEWTKAISGSLTKGKDYVPSKQGVTIYLNGGDNCDEILKRVEKAGGKVVVPKTKVSDEFGYFGMIIDTEGNKLGIQSMQ